MADARLQLLINLIYFSFLPTVMLESLQIQKDPMGFAKSPNAVQIPREIFQTPVFCRAFQNL